MEFIDNTGKPRSNQDIIETINALKKEMITGQINPIIVFFPTILNALEELLERRKENP